MKEDICFLKRLRLRPKMTGCTRFQWDKLAGTLKIFFKKKKDELISKENKALGSGYIRAARGRCRGAGRLRWHDARLLHHS